MLSSMMSTMNSVLSTTSATSSAISMFATVGVSDISIITIVCLIMLLCASEILSTSKRWNKRLSTMLKLAIFPLIAAFFAIVIFKVAYVLAI